ncbi:MAG: hypothetical protein VB858_16845 [Planctomycetaceae bacterium]
MDHRQHGEERPRPGRVSGPGRGVPAIGLLVALCAARAVSYLPGPSTGDTSAGDTSASFAPSDAVEAMGGFADESRCIECHAELTEFFSETGHARTLIPATHPDSLGALQMESGSSEPVPGLQLEVLPDGVLARHIVGDQTPDRSDSQLLLQWCFGSGDHARTWAGTLTDSRGTTDLVEFRQTHYHAIDGFDITPGQPVSPEGYFQELGMLYDRPKARRCFACHSTRVMFPDGRLDESSLQPGVTCQRCQGRRQAHVESAGQITDSFWKTATQLESVNRCGQCHRRADEQKPDEISPDNPDIVRFQPVGLIQSACFTRSPEMTCMTCHDPHKPLSAQNSLGIWQCTQCHDGTPDGPVQCAAGHRQDCLRCHMPRVRQRKPIDFTDHWIRIRKANEIPDPAPSQAGEKVD